MRRTRELFGWVVVGVGGAALELGLLRVLVDGLLWAVPIASFVAAEALIIGKFLVTDRFVFGHPHPTYRRAAKYQGASTGALAVSWLVLNGFVLVGVVYPIAFLVGTAAAFTWSLLTNFLWVWAVRR